MPAVEPDEFLAVILKYSIIGNDQKILGPRSEIWDEISGKFANKISAKYAYTIAKCNRYHIFYKYL